MAAAMVAPEWVMPVAFGWYGAAAEVGMAPSIHFSPHDAHTPCAALGVRMSTYSASCAAAWPAEEAAGQAGVRLPPCYLVLSLALGRHPDEALPGIDPRVVARRKLRRLRNELERRAHEPALSSLTVDGGTVLHPMAALPDQLSTSDWNAVGELVRAMSKAAGTDITAGATVAEPAAVADAAKVAREVLQVAIRAGHPPGIYRLDDLLLEYQLSRPSPARARLAAVLDPVADNPELLETLAEFLRLGGRRPTASKLHVHPNTIDYRLRRIHDLTGLDATRPSDISTLGAALAARQMSTADADS